MKLLALDTATEQCSVALLLDGRLIERKVQTARGHAELILPMIEAVLRDGEVSLNALDALAFGRGPGAFTGVRIAVSVAQGLALGAGLPVVPVSNLAAVAQQFAQPGRQILVCMDARMGEVYWGVFGVADGWVQSLAPEQVSAPQNVRVEGLRIDLAVGTGFGAYPILTQSWNMVPVEPQALPAAAEIARLAARDFNNGLAVCAAEALPVYLRNQVTHVKQA